MLFHVNAAYLGLQPAALPINYAFLGLRSESESPVIPLPPVVTTYVGRGGGMELRKPTRSASEEEEELVLLFAFGVY
jgi:hypothetical protein